MRIKMKTLSATPERTLHVDHVYLLPDVEAALLVERGFAVPVGPDGKPVAAELARHVPVPAAAVGDQPVDAVAAYLAGLDAAALEALGERVQALREEHQAVVDEPDGPDGKQDTGQPSEPVDDPAAIEEQTAGQADAEEQPAAEESDQEQAEETAARRARRSRRT